ncbi:MAG: CapA family protein [bacterium]
MRIAAVGDIMLQHPIAENPLHAILRDADAGFANLEVPLSDRGEPADKPIAFRSDPGLATELSYLGLDVVSFANNHSLDYGIPALLDTIAAVEEAGVAVIGAGSNLDQAMAPRMIKGNIRVAFLAFCSTLPVGSAATTARPGVAPIRVRVSILADAPILEEQPGTSPYMRTELVTEDVDRARAAIEQARRNADAVVVSIHWGVPPGWVAPFQGMLADYQQPLGRALVDAGADLILGHHPHTLHGIEIYRRKFIAYSLGHFAFHSLAQGKPLVLQRPGPPYRLQYIRPPEVNESAVFVFEIDDHTHWRAEIIPCAMNRDGECEPVQGERQEAIVNRFARHCEDLGTAVEVRAGRGVIDGNQGEER